MLLVEAAATEWGVPISECSAANSVITHAKTNRSTTYGKVAAAAAQLPPPLEVTLKDPQDWKVAGKPIKRLDTLSKLDGSQIYGADLNLPGMLNAAIKACPVFGGTLKSFDESAVAKMPGVKAVVPVEENAVAVVADTWWQAKVALDALPIEWDKGEHANESSEKLEVFLSEGLDADEAFIGNQRGDAQEKINGSAKVVTADYHYPFQNHATMEPMNATALWTKDRCEVWCPTQNGESALAVTAEVAGIDQTQCEVYKLSLGGGFGRRSGAHDYVRQAVTIAKQLPGTPVKLLWSREEDMQHGMYHPLTKARMAGGLDENGNLTGLKIRISGQSILAELIPQGLQNGADMLVFQAMLPEGAHAISYDIPDLMIDHAMRQPHVPPGFWRGVNVNQNAVYMECFLDELAHAAGRDPLDFRRSLMKNHPKNLAVLEAAAAGADYDKPAPKGIHRGLAVCNAFGSYVAACAEVSVTDGELKIHRIVAATDPGYAVNPQQIKAQISGSFVYGLSAMLYGECTVKDGAIEQSNFHDYPSLRIAMMPEVKSIVMPSGGFWGGVGEPTIAVAAPAVLNAIFAATGKRIRRLPLKDQDLSSA
jgi:isoquinoline 1-oxidoreductase beta subunit